MIMQFTYKILSEYLCLDQVLIRFNSATS